MSQGYYKIVNTITATIDRKIDLIKMVRQLWPDSSLVQSKELVEAVGFAFASVYCEDSINMFTYMHVLQFGYRLRVKDDLHYCVDSISYRYADARVWRVKKVLLHQWLDERVV